MDSPRDNDGRPTSQAEFDAQLDDLFVYHRDSPPLTDAELSAELRAARKKGSRRPSVWVAISIAVISAGLAGAVLLTPWILLGLAVGVVFLPRLVKSQLQSGSPVLEDSPGSQR